ncbi:ROK family protein [Robinsoniella sp.]|uniref:ROK family protein n=1 Tax=Robinsoniella sp. TaxID=2496533 RepID=UPI0037524438
MLCKRSVMPWERESGRFFDLLQAGDESAKKVWEKYLEDLAVLVTDLRMVFDCDIILGGYVGGYLKKYIMDLNKKVVKLDPFDNDTTYLQTCRYEREASAVGIAMRFIEKYFDMLL